MIGVGGLEQQMPLRKHWQLPQESASCLPNPSLCPWDFCSL
jgi:hypothetical protein